MTEERLHGAVKQLRNTIAPLILEQPHWDGYRAITADPLYTRMRIALTATTPVTGGRLQASKAPARIDVMAWFCDVDDTVHRWIRPGRTTIDKLERLHDYRWTPEHLDLIKAITRRCDAWTESAKELLQDNPPVVPLHGVICPKCSEKWAYRMSSGERLRTPAITVSEHGAQCHACRVRWITETEQALFKRLIGIEDIA